MQVSPEEMLSLVECASGHEGSHGSPPPHAHLENSPQMVVFPEKGIIFHCPLLQFNVVAAAVDRNQPANPAGEGGEKILRGKVYKSP